MYHVSQNKTEMPAYEQSPSENNWSAKREEWRQRDLQNIIPNSFEEKEKNCSKITRIALTKREDVEAVCPHNNAVICLFSYRMIWSSCCMANFDFIFFIYWYDVSIDQLDVASWQRCIWSFLFAYIPHMIFGPGIFLFDKKMLLSPCSVAVSYCCRLYSWSVLSFVFFKQI